MSVNPDMSATMGVAEEYVDLEHQLIRQVADVQPNGTIEVVPGDAAAETDPGERQLDREEVAQLVYYRRYAYAGFEDPSVGAAGDVENAIIDASIGINGDLFREVTTESNPEPNLFVDRGGEIGLLDNYTLQTGPQNEDSGTGGQFAIQEFAIPFYDWPTGGPIVDSFDTITAGFKADNNNSASVATFELRYDFWWDVAEQGRTTNPFGRPSTR